ncbi:Retrovirus-related Pol polyprotein from transposon opus [Eumeta japonica]|uniref:Retrovirus-related Pol polyprotein from transposon opus n=1 Tax=Eumeta variegata TaxID=151549 RepID=A0A4C1XY33_EUMVA|nr:Retrovirus-related Pol polyprotein from transposon opus [Eumeta japonica]
MIKCCVLDREESIYEGSRYVITPFNPSTTDRQSVSNSNRLFISKRSQPSMRSLDAAVRRTTDDKSSSTMSAAIHRSLQAPTRRARCRSTEIVLKQQPWIWGFILPSDYNKPFILRTDASNYALGADLLLGEGKDERSIACASHFLAVTECNYTTPERAALAVVWDVEIAEGLMKVILLSSRNESSGT